MPTRCTSLLGLLALAALISGCDPEREAACEPACEVGLVCTDGQCTTARFEIFEGEAPGRAVRVEAVGGLVYVATIDPQTGQLLVGRTNAGAPTLYMLDRLSRPQERRLSLTSSDKAVALAWLGADDRYRVAVHQLTDRAERWRVLEPAEAAEQTYRGSQHFDLALADSGRLQLVFHDRDERTLRRLSAVEPGQQWQLETVDDPAQHSDEAVCSKEQRELSGQGVGHYPAIASFGGATYIAYHDADCGDLKLARRLDGQWMSSVLDAGEFEREHTNVIEQGVTGRFASVAFDRAGNLTIAYHDATRGQLLIAHERDGRFEVELVDEGFELDSASRRRKHLVGAFASLVFDGDNRPHIAYLDATSMSLRLAGRTRAFGMQGVWTHRTLQTGAPTGFSASLSYSSELGLFVAAEQLLPQAEALTSRLLLLGEEDL